MEQGKHSVQSNWIASKARGKLRTSSLGNGGRNYDSRALDSQAKLLLVVQGLLGIANALSGTFVPVYLWKASQSLALIGWFNLVQTATSGLTFWIAGKWVKEHNKMHCLRLGVALSGAFYLAVLLMGRQAVTYAIPLGLMNGIALGLFWIAYNVVYFEVTEPGNRDRFNGLAGFLGSGAGILSPWISGWIITNNQGERGYSIIFTISVAMFAIAVAVSFWLKKREPIGRYEWLHGVRQLSTKGSAWRRVFPAIMAQGVREGVFMFLINLLVYISTSNEQKVGNFSLITSFVALASFWLIGRVLTPARRKIAMLIGTIAVTTVIIPLFWPIQYGTLLMFGIGTAIFMPLYIIPMTSTVFDLIGQNDESAKQREEFIVLREAGLTTGRILGLSAYLLVLPFSKEMPHAVPILMFVVGAFPIVGWLFIRPYLSRARNTA
ncbi:YQGE family putative transporter [Paenibacillus phyllosphaerae]|uniref:YQGE family putative transporter n=1 Tax=Paenibacillus phyllosphaerae TaxID=274593 RepID=A0A7W5FRB1_9BACL|nr:MFS transporter [Paenibacillus phyllosphaerae]MBB3114340.1 YQGE family putative transporter [Paenibacillus phyllosphaerae]